MSVAKPENHEAAEVGAASRIDGDTILQKDSKMGNHAEMYGQPCAVTKGKHMSLPLPGSDGRQRLVWRHSEPQGRHH